MEVKINGKRFYNQKGKSMLLSRTKERKTILILDGGYEGGDIHVYEHKETSMAISTRTKVTRALEDPSRS